MKYKLFRFIESENDPDELLLEKVKLGKNDFNSPKEAFDYMKKNKNRTYGGTITVLPIVEID